MKQLGPQSVFRGLIVVSAICYVCLVASRWVFWPVASGHTYLALTENGENALLRFPQWFFWTFGLLWLAAAFGAYRFNGRARLLLAWLAAFGLVAQVVGGLMVQTAFEALVGSAGTLATGGALALAYYSPLAERFGHAQTKA